MRRRLRAHLDNRVRLHVLVVPGVWEHPACLHIDDDRLGSGVEATRVGLKEVVEVLQEGRKRDRSEER